MILGQQQSHGFFNKPLANGQCLRRSANVLVPHSCKGVRIMQHDLQSILHELVDVECNTATD